MATQNKNNELKETKASATKDTKAAKAGKGSSGKAVTDKKAADALKRQAEADKKKAEADKKKAEADKKKAEADKKKAEADKKKAEANKKKASGQKQSQKKTDSAKKTSSSKSGTKKSTSGSKKSNFLSDSMKFISGLLFKKMAQGGAGELRSNAEEVNQLNVFPVPDGDTGDNMSMTIDSGVAAIENIESDDIGEVSEALSRGMLLGARGNSGVILSQFFAGISRGLSMADKADPKVFGRALELGVAQAYSSVMTPTEGTILTVAREAVEYAVSRINSKSTIQTLFNDLVKEMHESLDRTPELLAALKDAGVVDSGAAGLFYIMDGFNRVLGGEEITDAPAISERAASPVVMGTSFGADSEMTFAYCTEMLVQLTNKKCNPDEFDVDALKAYLASLGDSVVAFKVDSVVKIHVHTYTPDKVLGHMLGFGEFLSVKIENMSLQHTELGEDAPDKAPAEAAKPAPAPEKKEKKKNAIVAVCSGDGMENIYRELGCDVVIRGGQTQNPSTSDFLAAFDTLSAENIFVFPNNGNIVMAAEQAGELYSDASVIVLPSKNVGVGYAALAAADLTAEPEELKASMLESISRVTAGYISPSIRDTQIDGVNINNGDTLGIIGKEIVVSVQSRVTAAVALADALLSKENVFMLTAFVGEDAEEEEIKLIEEKIRAMHPDVEIYFANGGQDIYPYIFVAE